LFGIVLSVLAALGGIVGGIGSGGIGAALGGRHCAALGCAALGLVRHWSAALGRLRHWVGPRQLCEPTHKTPDDMGLF